MPREQKVYTREQKLEAIARVETGENLEAVSKELGIPRTTLRDWYTRSQAGGELQDYGIDHASLWGEASSLAARLIQKQLARYDDEERDLTPRDLQSVAIVGGISTDKHLDYRDGRTKGGINVDNRQVHLQVSAEQAKALIAEAGQPLLEGPSTPSETP
jgi:transposase-like protein